MGAKRETEMKSQGTSGDWTKKVANRNAPFWILQKVPLPSSLRTVRMFFFCFELYFEFMLFYDFACNSSSSNGIVFANMIIISEIIFVRIWESFKWNRHKLAAIQNLKKSTVFSSSKIIHQHKLMRIWGELINTRTGSHTCESYGGSSLRIYQ